MVKGLNKLINGEEKMKPMEMFKIGAGLVVSIGVDFAVCSLFGSHLPAGNGVTRIFTRIGTAVLAMMAGEAAEDYVYKVCDDITGALEEAKEEAEKAMTEEEGNES